MLGMREGDARMRAMMGMGRPDPVRADPVGGGAGVAQACGGGADWGVIGFTFTQDYGPAA